MSEESELLEFLPGYTPYRGTKPGEVLKDRLYKLKYSKVLFSCTNRCFNFNVFNGCYNWTDVMNILLQSLEQFRDINTCEELAVKKLKSWFLSYPGWGLLSTLLPAEQHILFKQIMKNMKENWSQIPNAGEYTEKKCWWIFCQDKDIEAMIPQIQVTIDEETLGPFAIREKLIKVKFVTEWCTLEVRFIIGKYKMGKGNLVTMASKAVAARLEKFDDVEHLEIPRTLMNPVLEMMGDKKWISNAFPSLYEISDKLYKIHRELEEKRANLERRKLIQEIALSQFDIKF